MALIQKQNKKLTHPTEDGAWFVVRVPLSAGDLASMRADGSTIRMSLDLAAQVIQSWSYAEPVTLENVELLDLDTFTWLTQEVQAASGIRTDDEKKGSANGSSPTAAPAAGASRRNSAT